MFGFCCRIIYNPYFLTRRVLFPPFRTSYDDWFVPFNLDKGGNRKTNCSIDTVLWWHVVRSGDLEVSQRWLERGKEAVLCFAECFFIYFLSFSLFLNVLDILASNNSNFVKTSCDNARLFGSCLTSWLCHTALVKWGVELKSLFLNMFCITGKVSSMQGDSLFKDYCVYCRDLSIVFKVSLLAKNIIISPSALSSLAVFAHCCHVILYSACRDESTPLPVSVPCSSDGCFVLFHRGEEHHELVTLSRVPTSGSTINLPQQLCPCTCLSLCKGDGKSFLVIIFPLAYAHFTYRT